MSSSPQKASTAPLLAGIKVLDLASVGPAARCSRMLADYGAEVIKVGPTAKHGQAQIQPPYFSYGAGRGWQKMQINLKEQAGKDTFLRLSKTADVVIESFRPGVAARIGVGYEAVRAVNPGIVYCSVSGYGQDGPYKNWAGHDINYLALGGLLGCQGKREDGGPAIPGATVADSAGGGMQAVIAILAALLKKQTTGEGAWLDVSIADGVLSLTSLNIEQYLATGEEPKAGNTLLTGRYACYDVYECADGKWISVGAIENVFYRNLCRLLDCEALGDFQMDDAKQAEIRAAFAQAFQRKTRDVWVAELAPNDTCTAPVYGIAELVDDPQLLARHVFCEAEHEKRGVFRQVGPVLAGGNRLQPRLAVADRSTTQTDGILQSAGFEANEIAKLRSEGIVE